jgi:hypothetical protein
MTAAEDMGRLLQVLGLVRLANIQEKEKSAIYFLQSVVSEALFSSPHVGGEISGWKVGQQWKE